jgi:aminoglycoside phosphotransferase (APT) family kinase protein
MHSPPGPIALIPLIQKAFPHSKLLHTWPLDGGISATMVALEIQLVDGQSKKVIVRSHAHSDLVEKEFRLLQILQAQAVKTPVPYLFDQSGTAASLVIDYLEGEMCFAPVDLDSHMRQLASQLAHIHGLDLSQHDVTFLAQNDGECLEMFRERPSPNPNFPQETEIRTRLVAQDLPEPKNKIALLHGDFWPGNSLWQDGQLTAVIDWEDAQLGDPLIDLAQSRSEIAWIFGPQAMENFTHHYQQQMPLDYTALPYWDLCAALRQIRLVGDDLAGFADYFAGYGRSDITPTTIRQNLNTFINNALVRLDH